MKITLFCLLSSFFHLIYSQLCESFLPQNETDCTNLNSVSEYCCYMEPLDKTKLKDYLKMCKKFNRAQWLW